ncbi:MAG: YhdP family protein [Chromatiales bacterium]
MVRRLTLSLLNVLWKTTALLVVTAAVLVSVARLLLPGIDRYREPIADWVSAQVGQPVEFDGISASWRGWTPVIELNNVRLLNEDGGKPITRFAMARLALDPRRSLARREVVPGRLTVSGMQVSLARSEEGVIRIEGAGPEHSAAGLQRNLFAYWVQRQRQLTIEQAAITWHDRRLLKPLIFSNVTLVIRADGERRQLEGTARLPQAPGSRFRFLLDIRGDLLTTAWSGAMYLEGKGIEPSMLLDYSRWLGLEASGGQLDFQAWSDWQGARLTRVNARFNIGGADIGTHVQRVRVNALNGTVVAAREAPGQWQVSVNPLAVQTANGAWPDSRLGLRIVKSAAQSQPELLLNWSFLRLQDLSPVIADITVLPAAIRDAVADLQPHGNLRDLRLSYDPTLEPGKRAVLQATVEALSTAPRGQLPGVRGISGQLAADALSGRVTLSGGGAEFNAPGRYGPPLGVQRAEGIVGWARDGDGWRIAIPALKLQNADLATTLRGQVALRPHQAPLVNLLASVEHADVSRLARYLPTDVGPKARAWLTQALAGGRIVAGGVMLRGALDRFPFAERDGKFEARLQVADGELRFDPDWPPIREIDAEVEFAARRLTVRAANAKTLEAIITDTVASIDGAAPRRAVIVAGRATATTAAARSYIENTPLKDSLKGAQTLVADAGKLALDLKLEIPLHHEKTTLQGRLGIDGAKVGNEALGVEVSDLAGNLDFTHSSFEATGLSGRYAGRPVELSVAGTASGNEVRSDVRISGRGDATFFSERLHALAPAVAAWLDHQRVLEHIKGETDWEVAAATTHAKGALRVSDLRIGSSLAGLALDLPSPLRKEAASTRRLNVHADLSTSGARMIDFALGGDLKGALLLKENADGASAVERATLQFGGAPAQLPRDSDTVQIRGSVAEVSVSDWLDALHERVTLGAGAAASSAPPLPVDIDLAADRVEVLGRYFDGVHLQGESGAQQWRFKVAGAQIEGLLTVPHRLRQDITRIDLRRLQITRRAVEHTALKINPVRLPPVSIRCEQFAYQDTEFGRAELSTRPTATGLRLVSLTFDSPASTITAQGEWNYVDDIHTSRFDIHVQATELDKLLAQFGYGVTAVAGGKTALDINATWAGMPAEFTLEKLDGSLAMSVKEGQFLDINNPATGRLFGLLSIQTLPRRLTLDFNDLFNKGMSFDRITGTFELDAGNAYTNNLTMEGSSARIEVTGRTGLAGKDYDQFATVTPQISDSLPVASALFGPAGAGVGAAIFLGKKIIPQLPAQIDKMLAKQYTITGHWENPVIEQIRNTPPGEPPAADG